MSGLLNSTVSGKQDVLRPRARNTGQAYRTARERRPVVGHQAEGLGGQQGEDREVDAFDLEEGIRQQRGYDGGEDTADNQRRPEGQPPLIMSVACAYAPSTAKPTWPSDISLISVTLRRLLTSRILMASRPRTVNQYRLPDSNCGIRKTTTTIAIQTSELGQPAPSHGRGGPWA